MPPAARQLQLRCILVTKIHVSSRSENIVNTNLSFGGNVFLDHPLESWKFSSDPKKTSKKPMGFMCCFAKNPRASVNGVFTGESNLWTSRPQASNWDLAAGKPAMDISANRNVLPGRDGFENNRPAKNSQILRVPQIRSYLSFWVPEKC